MTLQISGKSMDVGDALRGHISERIEGAVSKYFGRGYTGHVNLEKEGSSFKSECKIHLDSGIVLSATGSAGDAYPAFDQAAERMEKRLRRYKRRLKDHRTQGNDGAAQAYILAAPQDDEEDTEITASPAIIAENTTAVLTMAVSTAVMAMDLAEQDVFVFRHPDSGEINVLHKRSDGNIGWIDPTAV